MIKGGFIYVCCLIAVIQLSAAQNKEIDPLKKTLTVTQPDTSRAIMLSAIGYDYTKISKYDSTFIYAGNTVSLSKNKVFKTRGGSVL